MAPAATPRVPTSVTTSGLIPSLMNRLMNGDEGFALPEGLEPVEHGGRRLVAIADRCDIPVGARAYCRRIGATQATATERSRMSDKSPRQSKSAKTGKSIKEKRAEKREAESKNGASSMSSLTHKKR